MIFRDKKEVPVWYTDIYRTISSSGHKNYGQQNYSVNTKKLFLFLLATSCRLYFCITNPSNCCIGVAESDVGRGVWRGASVHTVERGEGEGEHTKLSLVRSVSFDSCY
jgi:hypothetical protein